MQDVYKDTEECYPNRKYNVLIVFDDMIADLISNNELHQMITELFFR